jgi:PBSX family phage terminase large subunit
MGKATTISKKSLNLNSQYGITEVFVKHDYYAGLKVTLLKDNEDGTYQVLKDTGDTLEEVETITTERKIYEAPTGFLSVQTDYQLKYIYEDSEHAIPRYKYINHVGSSRSSKSWSIEEWCIRQCEENDNLRVNIWRDTRQSLGDSVWTDFKKLFPLSGRSYKFPRNTTPIYFEKTNSTIEPHGADTTNAHGITQDIAWLNEPYLITKDTFDQIDQRANQVIFDMNPKQAHWSDDVSKHPRCKTIHSTFQDNPFCPLEQKRKILGYDPDNFVNVTNGTANEYKWKVYGLGEKAEKPDKIYHNWNFDLSVDEFGAIDWITVYSIDFGSSSPASINRHKWENALYTDQLYYGPIGEDEEGKDYYDILQDLGVPLNAVIVCDSAKPVIIATLRRKGYKRAVGANKNAGSVLQGITWLQMVKHFVTSRSTKIEGEYDEYSWALDRYGLSLEAPIKKNDHAMDAIRYAFFYIVVRFKLDL